jgi:hypothetical protein
MLGFNSSISLNKGTGWPAMMLLGSCSLLCSVFINNDEDRGDSLMNTTKNNPSWNIWLLMMQVFKG